MALLSAALGIRYDPDRTAADSCSILESRSAVRRLRAEEGPEMATLSGEPLTREAPPALTEVAGEPSCDVRAASEDPVKPESRCSLIVVLPSPHERNHRCDNSRTPRFRRARRRRLRAFW